MGSGCAYFLFLLVFGIFLFNLAYQVAGGMGMLGLLAIAFMVILLED